MGPAGSVSWWGEELLERSHDDALWAVADRAVTYRELRAQVASMAARLTAEGIGSGSSVALHMPPSLTLLYAMFAVWARGAQVMLIDIRSTVFEVDRLLGICEPQYVLSATYPPQAAMYLVEDVPFTVERRPAGRPATEDVCLVQSSSGSTGEPKVIGRTPASLLQELQRYAALEGMPNSGDRVVLLNSVIHTMGLVGGILHGLNSAAEMVFPPRMRAKDIVATARSTAACAIFGVPVHFALLARSACGAVPSLRLAVSAGELLPVKVWTQFRQQYGVPVSPIYGTTETGLIAADLVTGPEPPIIGRPAPGIEVGVVSGELRIRMDRSPYLWADRADRFHNGWLRTFDRCDQDARTGSLAYRGRADSVIAVGGLKVDLTEVEQVLLLHPHVREAVVIFGEVVEAHVGGDTSLTAADLLGWCRTRLADYKVPKIFRLSETVPRNANGKIIRNRAILHAQKETGAHTHH
ncbi:class I adenylate-forming enzyme family protein [Streptomyces sp. MB09-02B]|uniref:class I adenylate-forming enzyme family protein n=1 Tax=Streptomyces sp. MB09-02B TaxID=3028667 RepID=UPI0029BF2DF5|nr:class I adenylate-forming enzyme family protein [Streptomyces sp. MB09-02B]MDX3638427.1 class I adenylate-forming enzyme family protein [Streptomyces sp. MB09-02B]